jgi:hypothetical protein
MTLSLDGTGSPHRVEPRISSGRYVRVWVRPFFFVDIALFTLGLISRPRVTVEDRHSGPGFIVVDGSY